MADAPKLDPDGLPDDAAVEALLGDEGKGPLKSLAEVAAIEDETGKDEQQQIDESEETIEEEEAEAEEAEAEAEAAAAAAPTETEKVLASVIETQKQIAETIKAMAERAPAKTAEPVVEEAPAPAHIQRLIDSDDPEIRSLGEAMLIERREMQTRLDKAEAEVHQRKLVEQTVAYENDIATFGGRCEPPLTEMEKDWFVDRMTESRNGAEPIVASLTVEEGIKKLFPTRLKATNGRPGTAPKGAEGERPVVKVKGQRPEKGTIDDRGGSAGPKSTLKQPPPNETTEQAVERGFAQIQRR